jgi:hypothetical protein
VDWTLVRIPCHAQDAIHDLLVVPVCGELSLAGPAGAVAVAAAGCVAVEDVGSAIGKEAEKSAGGRSGWPASSGVSQPDLGPSVPGIGSGSSSVAG